MSDNLKALIGKVADGNTLSMQEATEAFDTSMSGNANRAPITYQRLRPLLQRLAVFLSPSMETVRFRQNLGHQMFLDH